jgi:hypothetical protein
MKIYFIFELFIAFTLLFLFNLYITGSGIAGSLFIAAIATIAISAVITFKFFRKSSTESK